VKHVTRNCKSCVTLLARLAAAIYDARRQTPSRQPPSEVSHEHSSLSSTSQAEGLARPRLPDVWCTEETRSPATVRGRPASQASFCWPQPGHSRHARLPAAARAPERSTLPHQRTPLGWLMVAYRLSPLVDVLTSVALALKAFDRGASRLAATERRHADRARLPGIKETSDAQQKPARASP